MDGFNGMTIGVILFYSHASFVAFARSCVPSRTDRASLGFKIIMSKGARDALFLFSVRFGRVAVQRNFGKTRSRNHPHNKFAPHCTTTAENGHARCGHRDRTTTTTKHV